MINTELLKEEYFLKDSDIQLIKIEGYSHVMIGRWNHSDVIIKILPDDGAKNEFLRSVYQEIECFECVNPPVRNKDGNHISEIDGHSVVLFKMLNKIKESPPAQWWAENLALFHQIPRFFEKRCISLETEKESIRKLWKNGQINMPADIKHELSRMLEQVTWGKKYDTCLVMNHGDPLKSNVMREKREFKFIDFESACISPKEYDIQRHLWDYAVYCSNCSTIAEYWKVFRKTYENHGLLIDRELLCQYYMIDFCKAICWLSIVSGDHEREDYMRQKSEYEQFILSVRSGNVQRMLECVKEED